MANDVKLYQYINIFGGIFLENKNYKNKISKENRPQFPKRAVVTGGMPYGNKLLHFGHVGGMFVFADVYARFLRDRIGEENVVFVSGTDCYGSPLAEAYRKLKEENGFDGTIEDFALKNHLHQKKTLEAYGIAPNLFAASGLGRASEIHKEFSKEIINKLYENGHLTKISTKQFFDEKLGVFLNGRQVVGKCPVQGCQAEKGYADECDLGHQYMPENLIDPKSTLSGEKPIMKNVDNWYFNLTDNFELLRDYVENLKSQDNVRSVVTKTISEFLEPPVIYVMNDFMDTYLSLKDKMCDHELIEEPKKTSFIIKFEKLNERDKACEILTEAGVRFRTGKTLVPFRLTGNIKWGVPAPVLEGEEPLTVWVWPESLWAPISFTKTFFENEGKNEDEWKKYWCSKDAKIYQFIGQDNIYFYGIAQPAMFCALQGKDNISCEVPDGELQMSNLVANHHILFLDKKASSSGKVKPPMAHELLEFYTAEQLRMHFLSLGLGMRSVSFQPKPLNPEAKVDEQDPVVKEGFLLSNVFNRIIRTAFYDTQKYFDGIMPNAEISAEILAEAEKAILEYERFMYKFEFHQVTYVLDSFIRKTSKFMAKYKAESDKSDDNELRAKWLASVFYAIKVTATLLHPIAPFGTEILREYLQVDEKLWSWDSIFDGFDKILGDINAHKLKFLEPRFDFFTRHESQFKQE